MARAAFALTKEVIYTTLNFLLNKGHHMHAPLDIPSGVCLSDQYLSRDIGERLRGRVYLIFPREGAFTSQTVRAWKMRYGFGPREGFEIDVHDPAYPNDRIVAWSYHNTWKHVGAKQEVHYFSQLPHFRDYRRRYPSRMSSSIIWFAYRFPTAEPHEYELLLLTTKLKKT